MSDIDEIEKLIIPGIEITKHKRQEMYGKVAGGSGSMKPEKYQRMIVEKITKIKCKKTKKRLNIQTNEIVKMTRPNMRLDGFDYTEDFDGEQIIDEIHYYYNFKCVVGTGGAQTRSLREVYHFIQSQLRHLITNDKLRFVNILDGSEAGKHMSKFTQHLICQEEFRDIKKNVYIGDLRGFVKWFKTQVSV
jgi:hypothetical protein